MTDCIFCKIIQDEIPRQVLYENETVLVFLNIKPLSPGHALVVPKQHVARITDASADTAAEMMQVIQKIAAPLVEAAGAESFNLVYNHDSVAGQSIPHMHWHIIPRSTGDGLFDWEQDSREYAEGEWEQYGEKIRNALINS